MIVCGSLLCVVVIFAFPKQMKPVKVVSSELGHVTAIVEHDLQALYSDATLLWPLSAVANWMQVTTPPEKLRATLMDVYNSTNGASWTNNTG